MTISVSRVRNYMCPDYKRVLEITSDPKAPALNYDWSVRHAGLDQLLFKGQGQRLGILDTGSDPHHRDLEGQVTAANFIRGNVTQLAWRDDDGHGTMCLGEVVAKGNEDGGVIGVAPKATAFAGRILYGDDRDSSRMNMESDIADGVLGCIKEGCGVISMSIGGPGTTSVMRNALEQAVNAGIIPVAAAGNERLDGSPYASYPASYPTVVSVASANKENMPAWFSTMGTSENPGKPEIAVAALEYYWGCAPGYSNYQREVGTSQATPMIAGVALLWREAMQKLADEGKQPFPTGANVLAEFRKWLYRVAKDTNNNGWDPELGWGVLLLTPEDMPSA